MSRGDFFFLLHCLPWGNTSFSRFTQQGVGTKQTAGIQGLVRVKVLETQHGRRLFILITSISSSFSCDCYIHHNQFTQVERLALTLDTFRNLWHSLPSFLYRCFRHLPNLLGSQLVHLRPVLNFVKGFVVRKP